MIKSAIDWVHPMSSHIETLLIFKDNDVVHTLDKDQFDGFLDGEMGLTGLSGQYKAVYVQANYDWLIQALVCCYLPLDEEGYCEPDWPLPLQRLCDTAGPGPDFGAGRIRLACRSQCPISGFKDKLWDPSTTVFSAITKALDEAQGTLLHDVASGSYEEDEVTLIKRTLRNEEAAYRNQVQQLQQQLEQQKLIAERLQTELSELSLKRSSLDEHGLRQENDQLKMKVRELQLTNEKLRSVSASAQGVEQEPHIIQAMESNDVMSVVFHPGVGHVNLQPSQLEDYLDDPIAYAARQISMSKATYMLWLKHHSRPHCVVCDDTIPLIGNPKIFDEDADIYCEQHKPLE